LVNDQNVVVDSAEEMSQEFNKFFSSVFTKERTEERARFLHAIFGKTNYRSGLLVDWMIVGECQCNC